MRGGGALPSFEPNFLGNPLTRNYRNSEVTGNLEFYIFELEFFRVKIPRVFYFRVFCSRVFYSRVFYSRALVLLPI